MIGLKQSQLLQVIIHLVYIKGKPPVKYVLQNTKN